MPMGGTGNQAKLPWTDPAASGHGPPRQHPGRAGDAPEQTPDDGAAARSAGGERAGGGGTRRGTPSSVRKLLCAMDFSEPAEASWKLALDLAAQFEAEVILLHVVPEPIRLAAAYQRGYTPERLVQASIAEARRLLQNLAAQAGGAPPKTTLEVRRGVEFREISAVAREEGVDLIVMGAHGRTGIAYSPIGSVAERVVGMAPCPVLLVPDTPAPPRYPPGNEGRTGEGAARPGRIPGTPAVP